jgi:hypothetical protein
MDDQGKEIGFCCNELAVVPKTMTTVADIMTP